MQEYKRKLAAIFSADVAGYSRLMGDDETATVKTLTEYREVMYSLIKQHRGRVIDSPGDNLLAEFASVVDAAQCAVAIQKEIQSRNSALPDNRRMQFRVGINLGDVIEEGERIYGDGVNIAARLEALADPGGICISKTAFDHIESKLPLGYEFIGEQTVKNIERPVFAYKVIMDPRVVTVSRIKKIKSKSLLTGRNLLITGGVAVLLLIILALFGVIPRCSAPQSVEVNEHGPSLVILPFKNMSDDPAQEYFCDGITEELIHSLSKIEGLRVVSRTTSFYYKGKRVPISTIGKELSVSHALEGSVRKDGNKLRITVQLIKVADDAHLLSETYDREMKDIFEIQDEISKAIAEKLELGLRAIEKKREEVSIVGDTQRIGINVVINDDEIITGGLLATGINVEMSGSVKGGLKAYGGHVVISGTSQDRVDFLAGDITLSGHFKGIVKGNAGNVIISGTFEKDLEVDGKHITLAPEAVIKGNFIYSGVLDRQDGSQIEGEIKETKKAALVSSHYKDVPEEKSIVIVILGKIYWYINIIILGLFSYIFFPGQNEKILSAISSGSYVKTAMKGILFFIVSPFILFISIITIIGIPFGVIYSFLVTVIIFGGLVYGNLWLGRMLLRYLKVSFLDNFFISLITGIIILDLLSLIPFVGWIPKAIIFLLASSALWQVIWTALKSSRGEGAKKN